MKKSSIFLTITILFFIVCIIASPAVFLQAGLDGLSAWALCVLPSVLPFMFFTKILTQLGTLEKLSQPFSKVTQTLFHTPQNSLPTFLLAILSGYPVGSKMVANLFMQGQISQEEAFRMTAFCSTSGPMFIIGAVGAGMFGSAKVGYILFVSHVIGAILNGLLYRNLGIKKRKSHLKSKTEKTKSLIFRKEKLNSKPKIQMAERMKTSNQSAQEAKKYESFQTNQAKISLSEVVQDTAQSVLAVGVIITVFFIVIQSLSPLLNLLPAPLNAFLTGIIEITKGCTMLSKLSGTLAVTLTSFVISFGGISTILQSLTMISSIKMPVKLFVTQKITHATFSTILTILLLAIF